MTQSLALTPQMQQSIKMLQLSRLELTEMIEQALLENPALESVISPDDDASQYDPAYTQTATTQEESIHETHLPQGDPSSRTGDEINAVESFDWESYGESNQYALPPSSSSSFDEGDALSFEARLSRPESLQERLLWQLSMSELSEEEQMIGRALITEIDGDGFLPADALEVVMAQTGASAEQSEAVLQVIQRFDPVGVGARTLRECLWIQAQERGLDENPVICGLLTEYYDSLNPKELPKLARMLECTREALREALRQINTLSMSPAAHLSEARVEYVVPDIYVVRHGREFVIVLNEEGLPKLQLSPSFQGAAQQLKGDSRRYTKESLRSASWFIKCLQQRERTIYKVAQSLLKFQAGFFEHGVTHLRPLVLRQVADDIGMHESTVSRITTQKYIHTAHGIFELKFFFKAGLSKSGDEPPRRPSSSDEEAPSSDVASEVVKLFIKQLIDQEAPQKPLSDQTLSELIQQKHHIEVARRTVAKYREAMDIPTSATRRASSRKLF